MVEFDAEAGTGGDLDHAVPQLQRAGDDHVVRGVPRVVGVGSSRSGLPGKASARAFIAAISSSGGKTPLVGAGHGGQQSGVDGGGDSRGVEDVERRITEGDRRDDELIASSI
ncbi:hypothetical protein [Streptomyces olivochromogenes]|uniref:hypothetical protein n=1 Tax=Streptomyces olivochromogenes TaxID=1963 RepID=UPI0036A6FED8